MGTYPPKPVGMPVGMGNSFNLDQWSWQVRERHLVNMGLNATPVGLQKPAADIFQSKLCRLHI